MRQRHRTIRLETGARQALELTAEIRDWLDQIEAEEGLLSVFIRHTSASLTIMENADPDVMRDLTDFLARLAPEEADYAHDTEGPDDMPAHLKTALTQTHLSIPVIGGRLGLGTWQGIWLLEHRAMAHQRSVILHFIGE
ncbi:secondary thiamine-phosphate synthase enzyme YjbQ [Tepidicaulis marinus]|nr:secondary thiamine-phosphate synthase enzyme YjbQ [Tepidicaulis marinus]